jgi:hypothetical protein
MNSASPIEALNDACAALRRALEGWDPVDLKQVDRCSTLIESATLALQRFQSSFAGGARLAASDAGLLLQQLARDAKGMGRIVDACLAFQRGLALRLGDSAPAYGCSGAIARTASGAGFEGIEA